QRGRVPGADRRPGGGRADRPGRGGRGPDGLQAGGGADVGALEGEAPRNEAAGAAGRRGRLRSGRRVLHLDSAGAERARRRAGQRGDGRRCAGAPGAAEAAGPAPAAGWSDPDPDPTRLLLLRHGQTPLSVARCFAGVGDVEPTDAGRTQARAAAGRLAGAGIEAVVASPLRRTMDTAEIAAAGLGLQVEPEPGLRETDFGAWE